MPKELLPVVDKPLIQYAVEEAIRAGIDTMIFVTGRNKRAIEDHFDSSPELEAVLRAKGKHEQADMVRSILPNGVECILYASLSNWASAMQSCVQSELLAMSHLQCYWPMILLSQMGQA